MVRLSMAVWVAGVAIAHSYPLLAQIVPDSTLPENSIVNIEGELQRITGGTTAGGNLFHSFEQFNVRTGETARFEAFSTIDNIITRVTGGQLSHIDGLIESNGTANLFLLNPQGILFGANAQLDVGGSFVATSASSIAFADGSEFIATPDGETVPLLTVSVPVGLQFNSPNLGGISVSGPELIVPSRETLAFIGSDISISAARLVAGGRSFEDTQTTPAGRIELGSIREGSVNFTPGDRGLSFDYASGSEFGNIQLIEQTSLDLTGITGGDIQMVARNLQINNSLALTVTLGSQPGGDITVRATESAEIVGTGDFSLALPDLTADPSSRTVPLSGLLNFTFGAGNAGAIVVETPQLIARNNASILSGMQGESTGNAGALTIEASERVEVASSLVGSVTGGNTTGEAGAVILSTPQLLLRDNGLLLSATFGPSQGGDIAVEADEIQLIRAEPILLNPFITLGTGISSSAIEDGDGGDVTIDTGTLELRDGALITTGAIGSGSAGSVTVNASEGVELRGANTVSATDELGIIFNTAITVGTITRGDSGDLRVNTPRLILRDGAFIAANTFGEGAGGTIDIAADVVELSGIAADSELPTNISASSFGSFGEGDAGNLVIRADRIQLDRGAELAATTTAGERGNITLNTNTLQMHNGSQISTNTFGEGAGGTIDIDADVVELSGIAADSEIPTNISASSFGSFGEGDAGNLVIRADRIQLDRGAELAATSTAGEGGNITLNTDTLQMRNISQISTNTFGEGAGGTIIIHANVVELSGITPDGKTRTNISASSVDSMDSGSSGRSGDAGNLEIRADRIQLDRGAELAATSTAGEGGNITLNANTVQMRNGSRISTDATQTATGGNINIDTDTLQMHNISQISTNTFGEGAGGTIIIHADVVELSGITPDGKTRTNISASSVSSMDSESLGDAGNLVIRADRIQLDRGAELAATSTAGERGNITLNANTVQMRNGSRISTDATQTATGGNINIDTDTLVALENSDITANAQDSSGGRVRIAAQGIFGTEFREEPTPNSDITANSIRGEDGTVIIQTPNIQPGQGLVDLTSNPLDPDTTLARSCLTPSSRQRGRFAIVGAGGLPPSPDAPSNLPFPTYQIPARTEANLSPEESIASEEIDKKIEPIVEADGIFQLEDDRFVLGSLCG